MEKFGLKRYNHYKEKFQFEGAIDEVVETYGVDICNKGYNIYDFDRTGMMEIEKVDYLGVFEDDEAAVEQAIKDGVKIIPVEELPENFDRKYLGWIDTPENRKAIQEYCDNKQYEKKKTGLSVLAALNLMVLIFIEFLAEKRMSKRKYFD